MPQQNKSLWAADLGTPLHKKINIPKKKIPEAITYLRLIPRESASGLFFAKGNILSVISSAKKIKPMLSSIIIIPINASMNLELLNKRQPLSIKKYQKCVIILHYFILFIKLAG